uniref:(northern house mosquito) hypothetical protein n=1 Tax=Culex pipiens TaxID=7175 RepID=A0A8D8ETT6_CULPI
MHNALQNTPPDLFAGAVDGGYQQSHLLQLITIHSLREARLGLLTSFKPQVPCHNVDVTGTIFSFFQNRPRQFPFPYCKCSPCNRSLPAALLFSSFQISLIAVEVPTASTYPTPSFKITQFSTKLSDFGEFYSILPHFLIPSHFDHLTFIRQDPSVLVLVNFDQSGTTPFTAFV